MIKEENVTEEFSQTELGAAAQSDVQGEKTDVPNHSAVLGKFKDVNALVKAYESLQAEFTRRSQKLKDLERLAAEYSEKTEGAAEADSGAEKLRKNAQKRKETAKAFEDFVTQVESSVPTTDPSNGENVAQTSGDQVPVYEVNPIDDVTLLSMTEQSHEENKTETDSMRNASALVEGRTANVANYGIAESSDALFELANSNENVRLKIIGEYLRSIGRSAAPLTGGGTVATPPAKPSSIGDAGVMALRYFKNTAEK